MWHLILPPLVIIFGIGILLWFLSRKMGDASFLLRVASEKGEVVSSSRLRALSRKAFFLRVLEKMASRFKTNSLRIHNFFQSSLELLREKRKVIDELRREGKKVASSLVPGSNVSEEQPERSRGFVRVFPWGRKSRTAPDTILAPSNTVSVVETPTESSVAPAPAPVDHDKETLFPRKRMIFERIRQSGSDAKKSAESEPVPEPVLRKTVMHPEQSRPRLVKKDPREDELITRIAESPRDALAYEELGDLYLTAENMQDAKACYRQALKLHPTNRAVKLKIRKVERFFEKNVS